MADGADDGLTAVGSVAVQIAERLRALREDPETPRTSRRLGEQIEDAVGALRAAVERSLGAPEPVQARAVEVAALCLAMVVLVNGRLAAARDGDLSDAERVIERMLAAKDAFERDAMQAEREGRGRAARDLRLMALGVRTAHADACTALS